MACESSAIALQTVEANQPILFTEDRVPCTDGLVFHQNGSGVFLLASRIVTPISSCACRRTVYETLYKVDFGANVAIPTGGALGEIQVAIVVEGEPDQASTMSYTPAAVDVFGNIKTSIIVPVPSICRCRAVSVRNITASGEEIDVRNANIIFTPVGIQRAS